MEILCTLSVWSIVETRPRQPHQVALPSNTNMGMIRLDQHPLALREQVQLFFHPVQLHLELPNLLVELGLKRLVIVLLLCPSCRENLRHLLLQAVFPMGNLGRMYSVRTG